MAMHATSTAWTNGDGGGITFPMCQNQGVRHL